MNYNIFYLYNRKKFIGFKCKSKICNPKNNKAVCFECTIWSEKTILNKVKFMLQ